MLEVKDWSFNVGNGYTVKVVNEDKIDCFEVILYREMNYIERWLLKQTSNVKDLNGIVRKILSKADIKDHDTINAFIGSFVQLAKEKPFAMFIPQKVLIKKSQPTFLTLIRLDMIKLILIGLGIS